MTEKEFLQKYKLNILNSETHNIVYQALDILFLEFTKEQALMMIADYYDNADDIFNSGFNVL